MFTSTQLHFVLLEKACQKIYFVKSIIAKMYDSVQFGSWETS